MMKEYLDLLKMAPLFSGIDEKEIASLLVCLGARVDSFLKNDYVLRVGDSPESVGLVLSGSVFIIQETHY